MRIWKSGILAEILYGSFSVLSSVVAQETDPCIFSLAYFPNIILYRKATVSL